MPIGKTLSIKEGVTLLFNKGAGLLAQGEMLVNGTTNSPVVFKGKSTGIGFWRGIAVEASTSTDISCAEISGTAIGVTFKGGKPALRKSVVYGSGGISFKGSRSDLGWGGSFIG